MTDKLPEGLSHRYWSVAYLPNGDINGALKEGEGWIGSWSDVGLYDGNRKVPSHQILTIHLTTHRLILSPSPSTSGASTTPASTLSTDLRHVRQTEFYTGFMRSSPKITLTLGSPSPDGTTGPDPRASSSADLASPAPIAPSDWVCAVCGYSNAGRTNKCALCGVSGQKKDAGAVGVPASIPGTPERSATPRRSMDANTATGEIANGSVAKVATEVACPVCTFLNHASMRNCEICSTALPRTNGRTGVATPAAQGTGVTGAVIPDSSSSVIRLSFRKDGAKVAYAKVKSVLGQKAWERDTDHAARPTAAPLQGSSADGTATPTSRAGIDAVLSTLKVSSDTRQTNLSSAFADLEVLMVRAGEMVILAQSLNERLTSSQKAGKGDLALPGNAQEREEEATLIRSSLVQLGLPAPALTSDMVKSDEEYYKGLARELGALLTGTSGTGGAKGAREGLMLGKNGRGVIGLDEAWGLWMRARGVALLSPATLVSILPYLPSHTSPPIRSHALPSGLRVLYTPVYSAPSILARLMDHLRPESSNSEQADAVFLVEKGLTLIEIAAMEGLPIGLAKELMEEVEKLGHSPRQPNVQVASLQGSTEAYGLVRDDQAEQGAGGVRWYRDIISSWEL